MNVSVLLGHPYEQSFNAAIAVAVVRTLEENGHTVRFHDLYGEGIRSGHFWQELISDMTGDELLAAHQREIQGSRQDHRHPPGTGGEATARDHEGWVDRVLREGGAYGFPEGDNGGGLPIGLLKAKAALVFNTSNTPQEREETSSAILWNVSGRIVYLILRSARFDRIMFRVIADSTPEDGAMA